MPDDKNFQRGVTDSLNDTPGKNAPDQSIIGEMVSIFTGGWYRTELDDYHDGLDFGESKKDDEDDAGWW